MSKSQIRHTFVREERLKSRKLIARLFERAGRAYLAYPIRVAWSPSEPTPNAFPAQAAFSVSKRAFRKATQRNRIKRLMREAWRIHKHTLYERLAGQPCSAALMLIYVAKEELSWNEIEAGVKKLIQKFPVETLCQP
ncbi:MAG: ribonuclease P protein component [Saprospiraceae bacterium]